MCLCLGVLFGPLLLAVSVTGLADRRWPHRLLFMPPLRPTRLPTVPLLIGHGGNTGSQSNATIIRALALGHLRPSDWAMVAFKVGAFLLLPACLLFCRPSHFEAGLTHTLTSSTAPTPAPTTTHPPARLQQECVAGAAMGGALGALIMACSFVWSGLSAQVGIPIACMNELLKPARPAALLLCPSSRRRVGRPSAPAALQAPFPNRNLLLSHTAPLPGCSRRWA